jgi:hypothetical protein
MTPTISPPASPTTPIASPSSPGARRRCIPTRSRVAPLGRYTDADGRTRELIAGQGLAGSVLVLDRDAFTLRDRRLIAHLGSDEPAENAAVVCNRYLEDPQRGRCRQVTASDLVVDPYAAGDDADGLWAADPHLVELPDRHGQNVYLLELASGTSPAELRWRRHQGRPDADEQRSVSLREVIGAVESYEPAIALTRIAVDRYREDESVSVGVLSSELARLRESPIVLNRKLRESVLGAIEAHGLSMSEIALRCGRVKRDAKGNTSGETSWLARRLGLVPDSGASRPTPWIHSDVLALIARAGIGIGPHEVELL